MSKGGGIFSESCGAEYSFDRTVKLWEVSTGYLLADLSGHCDYVNTIVFSPDGSLLASGSGDDTIRIWWHK